MTDILSIKDMLDEPVEPFGDVGGVAPFPKENKKPFCDWQIEKGADHNYRLLGKLLSAQVKYALGSML